MVGAEQTELAHLVEDGPIDQLVAVGLENPRHQAVLRVVPGGRLDQALVFGELLVEPERVVPRELGLGRNGGCFGDRLQARWHLWISCSLGAARD
jgi:hypothetical protein